MTTPDQPSREAYRDALREYLTAGREDSLLAGYSIGRETIAEGLTSLIAIHSEALKAALASDPSLEHLPETIDRSTQFLQEALAPFEMTVRGFQESNDRLREINSRLETIFDTSLNAIITMDQRGVITGWNPQAEKIFGWRRDDVVGKILADTIIPPRYRAAHRTGLAKFLKTGEGPVLGKVIELTALERSGREFPMELAISPATRSDHEVLFVGFLRDITTRKQTEEAIDALNSELRQANQHKSEFLAAMSHELRTPLNGILGFSELLIDDTTGRFDAEARLKFLNQVHASGRHLLTLINEILDLSKVEAGRMSLQLETVTIADAVGEVVRTVQPLADKKRIRLDASHASGSGQLLADLGKLKQMLLNLTSNAIKFTAEGGSVTIAAERTGDAVEISVADTGVGIAEADRARLFKPFEQLSHSSGRRSEGTGLGLALTKSYAKLHGGDVRLTSELGKGSVFTISLPIREPEPVSLPMIPSAAENRPLVLIVEDNAQAAHLLARHLDQGGYRSEIAVNAAEALAKAEELRPVAITLDILLPGVDGWSVLTQLKHSPATREIPIVVISVVDEPELGRALGALDYLVKPVDAAALLRVLGRYNFTTKLKSEEVRILVIDDEPADRDWLKAVLVPVGFTVSTAGGGREGIELAKRIGPDLVLLDLMMPEVSGFDVVEVLRADEATSSIPIMILTAKDLTEEDKLQLTGHVGAILSKGSTSATDMLAWLKRLTPRTAA